MVEIIDFYRPEQNEKNLYITNIPRIIGKEEISVSMVPSIPSTIVGRGDGLEVEPMSRNPEGRVSIPRLGSRRSSLISIEHAELLLVLPRWCCAVPG